MNVDMLDSPHEIVHNIERYLKELDSSSTNSNKQEQSLERLIRSDDLLERYLTRSPQCLEMFKYLDEIIDTMADLTNSAVSININETNVDILFKCIERAINFYKSKLVENRNATLQHHTEQLTTLSLKSELKSQLFSIYTNLLAEKHIILITKCIQTKSTTKKTILLQETCVRLLTLCVQQSVEFAKQVALEYDYFNDRKNWLERYLLMKQTALRELSIQFLLSFLRYTKVYSRSVPSSASIAAASEEPDASKQQSNNGEYLFTIKRIFLNHSTPKSDFQASSSSSAKKGKQQSSMQPNNQLSLVNCLFMHVSSDSCESVELLLRELLFYVIKNDSVFNKSDKIKLFNERTLHNLTKLFEWRLTSTTSASEADGELGKEEEANKAAASTLLVRTIITEFFKVLFCSTRSGICFYDRTLNIDQSDKNNNYLIFNALINIARASPANVNANANATATNSREQTLARKTNELIDDLYLKTLRVCPDMTQRFLKVKQKQESNRDASAASNKSKQQAAQKQPISESEEDCWFVSFCTRLFEQQHSSIKKMRANYCATTSFLRSIATNDLATLPGASDGHFLSVVNDEQLNAQDYLTGFMCKLVIHTSLPLCIPFQNIFRSVKSKKQLSALLHLMIVCLRCVNEWKQCLVSFESDFEQQQRQEQQHARTDQTHSLSDVEATNEMKQLIVQNMRLLVRPLATRHLKGSQEESFFSKLNSELLTKYLPKFDLFLHKFELNLSTTRSSTESDATAETAAPVADVNDYNDTTMIQSFEIFGLYFDIFIKADQLLSQSDDSLADANVQNEASFGENHFGLNLLQIESLEHKMNKFMSNLLDLKQTSSRHTTNETANASPIHSVTSAFVSPNTTTKTTPHHLLLCRKYLLFLVMFEQLKQIEQCNEDSSADDHMHDFIAMHLRASKQTDSPPSASATSTRGYQMTYKNVGIFNLAKIMVNFSADRMYQLLISPYLTLISVYLKEDTGDSAAMQEMHTDDKYSFRYNKDLMYVWLLLANKYVEKCKSSASQLQQDTANVNASHAADVNADLQLFTDYIYICLFNLLNMKQRSSILFKMSMLLVDDDSNETTRDGLLTFDRLFKCICLKTFALLKQRLLELPDAQKYERALGFIQSFICDYLFSANMMLSDQSSSLSDAQAPQHNGDDQFKSSLALTCTSQLNKDWQMSLLFVASHFSATAVDSANGDQCTPPSNESETPAHLVQLHANLVRKVAKCTKVKRKLKTPAENQSESESTTFAELCIYNFEKNLNLKLAEPDNEKDPEDTQFTNSCLADTYLKTSVRVRHLLHLLSAVMQSKANDLDAVSLDIVLTNLKRSLNIISELVKFNMAGELVTVLKSNDAKTMSQNKQHPVDSAHGAAAASAAAAVAAENDEQATDKRDADSVSIIDCGSDLHDLAKLDYNAEYHLLDAILNNPVIQAHAFTNDSILRFLIDSIHILRDSGIKPSDNSRVSLKLYGSYLNSFLSYLRQLPTSSSASVSYSGPNASSQYETPLQNPLTLDFISQLELNRATLAHLVDCLLAYDERTVARKNTDEQQPSCATNLFPFFVQILIKNQQLMFEADLIVCDELNDLQDRHVDSLNLIAKVLSLLFSNLSRSDSNNIFTEQANNANQIAKLDELLRKCYANAPFVFKVVLRQTCSLSSRSSSNKLKLPKQMRRFGEKCSSDLAHIFESALKDDTTANKQPAQRTSESAGISTTVTSNSLEDLMNAYEFTLSREDRTMLAKMYKLDAKLEMLKFKLAPNGDKASEASSGKNLTHGHARMSDFVNSKLDDNLLTRSIQDYPIARKFNDLIDNSGVLSETENIIDSNIYDPIYMLLNLYNLLDYANILDVVQFVQRKLLSYLIVSLSSECDKLRSLAYAAIYRFVAHLENSRAYFKNAISYLLDLLRNSLEKENQRIPTVITAFLSEAIMVITEPGTTMYKPIMSFLLLKPKLDLANVPEFYKLFNSSSMQFKAERKWILKIMVRSCRTSFDYRLFEKRFIFRQLMSIYDAKLSDIETKLQILDMIIRTCSCKFALIDLIKRHYMLLWLAGILETSKTTNSFQNNEFYLRIFQKMLKIFNIVWAELGTRRNREIKSDNNLSSDTNGVSFEKNPEKNNTTANIPITFLNQIFSLMKMFQTHLAVNQDKLSKLVASEPSNGTFNGTSISINKQNILDFVDEYSREVENFFTNKNEIIETFTNYKFSLNKFCSEERLIKKIYNICQVNDQDTTFCQLPSVLDVINSKKRKSCGETYQLSSIHFTKRIKLL